MCWVHVWERGRGGKVGGQVIWGPTPLAAATNAGLACVRAYRPLPGDSVLSLEWSEVRSGEELSTGFLSLGAMAVSPIAAG